MAVPSHSQIHPGTSVSIVLKADQPTGRLVQGTVEDILTRGDHSRGVKVRLMDGRIGRVQQVLAPGAAALHSYSSPPPPQSQLQYGDVADQQPWQAHSSFPSTQSQGDQQHPGQQYGGVSDPQSWQAHTSFPSGHSQQSQPQYADHPAFRAPPRTNTAGLVPEEERSEQVETLQSFEGSRPESEDDIAQATLQREFPDIDSSLIAAMYSDSKSLSATRETLQALQD